MTQKTRVLLFTLLASYFFCTSHAYADDNAVISTIDNEGVLLNMNKDISEIQPRIQWAEVPSIQFVREKYSNGSWIRTSTQTLSTVTISFNNYYQSIKNPYGEEVWYDLNGVPTTRSYYVRYDYISK